LFSFRSWSSRDITTLTTAKDANATTRFSQRRTQNAAVGRSKKQWATTTTTWATTTWATWATAINGAVDRPWPAVSGDKIGRTQDERQPART